MARAELLGKVWTYAWLALLMLISTVQIQAGWAKAHPIASKCSALASLLSAFRGCSELIALNHFYGPRVRATVEPMLRCRGLAECRSTEPHANNARIPLCFTLKWLFIVADSHTISLKSPRNGRSLCAIFYEIFLIGSSASPLKRLRQLA